MAVCVLMVGQELCACVQYRPPLQCRQQAALHRAAPRRPPAASMSSLHVAGGWGWRVQGSAAVRPADFAPTV